MIIKKGDSHKHNFTKESTLVVPVRNDVGVAAHDTIKLRVCIEEVAGEICAEVVAYDLVRDVK